MKYLMMVFIGKRNVLLLVLLGLLTLTLQTNAEIYCVDDISGDDTNSGICDGLNNQPWKTVTKVSGIVFVPGDIVEFKRGGIWNEKLTIRSYSGADIATAPFIVRAWGELNDPLPIIDAAGTTEELAFRSYRSYLTIQDIHFKSQKIGMAFSPTGGSIEIVVEDIKIELNPLFSGTKGILFGKGGDGIRISNIEITGASNIGINFSGTGTRETGIRNVLVENSLVSGNAQVTSGNDGIAVHSDNAGGLAGSNFMFRDNIVENFAEQGFDITTGNDVTLLRNVTRNNGSGAITIGHTAYGVEVIEHQSYDEPARNTAAAIIISSKDVTIRNSTIHGSSGYHMMTISNGPVETNGSDAQNVNIINNTFVWDRNSSWIDIADFVDITFENNLFVTARQDTPSCVFRFTNLAFPPNKQGMSVNYNQYSAPNNAVCFRARKLDGNYQNYSFSEFQTNFGAESNGLMSDPQLVNLNSVDGDYHTTSNSTAIDAGNPASDFSQELTNNGNRINIGRYGNTAEATVGNDSDGDGLTNQNEWCYDGDCGSYILASGDLNIDLADTDGDTLNDADEINLYSTDPLLIDTDTDGFNDDIEIAAGSNPNSSSSIPGVATGDINDDGNVDVIDVLLATRIALGTLVPTTNQLLRGDAAPQGIPDGVINSGDLVVITGSTLNF